MGTTTTKLFLAAGVLIGTCALPTVSGCRSERGSDRTPSQRLLTAPVGARLTMAELHALGGVPRGWQFTPPVGDPEAGRRAFVEFGCYKCHRVAGETFPGNSEGGGAAGPDLTGMGAHHPPGYFAEAIVNPNAIVVDEPGYVSEDGSSKMPAYPDMTLAQLADLVAYLSSLKGVQDGEHAGHAEHAEHAHHRHAGAAAIDHDDQRHGEHAHQHLPPQGESRLSDSSSYLAQAFEVEDERIEDFYRWFDDKRFEQIPGLRSIETYASRERRNGRHVMLVLFGFEDDAALESFRRQQQSLPVGSFAHPVETFSFAAPPLYRALQMSHP